MLAMSASFKKLGFCSGEIYDVEFQYYQTL